MLTGPDAPAGVTEAPLPRATGGATDWSDGRTSADAGRREAPGTDDGCPSADVSGRWEAPSDDELSRMSAALGLLLGGLPLGLLDGLPLGLPSGLPLLPLPVALPPTSVPPDSRALQ